MVSNIPIKDDILFLRKSHKKIIYILLPIGNKNGVVTMKRRMLIVLALVTVLLTGAGIGYASMTESENWICTEQTDGSCLCLRSETGGISDCLINTSGSTFHGAVGWDPVGTLPAVCQAEVQCANGMHKFCNSQANCQAWDDWLLCDTSPVQC